MAGSSTETEVNAEPRKAGTLPFITVTDFQAEVLSKIVTFIFTVCLTVGFLILLKWLAGLLGITPL